MGSGGSGGGELRLRGEPESGTGDSEEDLSGEEDVGETRDGASSVRSREIMLGEGGS